MLALALLPLLLRLAILPLHQEPIPAGGDDFSYLLLGDTVAHFRLANPPHPLHRFFETDFVLQEPTYSSIYPIGQGIALAAGQWLAHDPWAGVLLTQSLLCALCYWMLLGWTTPGWALTGGLLAVAQFGPLCQWTNSYFGGGVSAIAGCFVFGSLPRLYKNGVRRRESLGRNAAILGLGFSLQLLTRPFECILLLVCIAVFAIPAMRHGERIRYTALIAVVCMLPAAGLTLLHNRAVTGDWSKLPYIESREQYGVPATFTFQSNPQPHRELTREQELDYRAQSIIHGEGPDTPGRFLQRLGERIHHYSFFFPFSLYPAILAFLWSLFRPVPAHQPDASRRRWIAFTILFFGLATNFYPYFYPHYIAALASLFLLVSIVGLQALSAAPRIQQSLVLLCGLQFAFWYGAQFLRDESTWSRLAPHQTPYFVPRGDPEGRSQVEKSLSAAHGDQLVFVRYSPQHLFREWVHNGSNIDASRIVWARDLGPAQNEVLKRHYPGRTAWLLQPDLTPPQLVPYPAFRLDDPETFVPSQNRPAASSPIRVPVGATTNPASGVAELPNSGFLVNKKGQ